MMSGSIDDKAIKKPLEKGLFHLIRNG